MRITDQMKDSFYQEGYLVLKDVEFKRIKHKIRQDLKDVMLAIISKNASYSANIERYRNFEFDELLNTINDLEKDKEEKITPIFYEAFPKFYSIIGLLSNDYIINVCKQLDLKLPSPATIPVCRIDRPNNNFYSTPWHQDGWYTMFCSNAITMWIPVIELSPEMGLMQIVPGSHALGVVPFREFREGHEPYVTVESEKFDFAKLEVMVKEDEILVFNQYLVHKSGNNISSKCRVSIQLRYNDFDKMENVFSTFTPVHAKAVLSEQQRLLKKWEVK